MLIDSNIIISSRKQGCDCPPNKNKKIAIAFMAMALFAIPLLLGGCLSGPLVSIKLLNRTGGACESADIVLNNKSEDLKANVPNGNASIIDGWPYPMPAKVKLHWVTEDKSGHSVTLALPPPSTTHADFLDYEFVILPVGRANVAVNAWSDSTDAEVRRGIAISDDLGRDGGPNYRVAVKNMTGRNVDDLDVRFGPYAVNAGTHLSSDGQNFSIATALPYPITSSVSLHWVTSDGGRWAKAVEMSNVMPADINGKCFWFILDEHGGVSMQIVKWDDLRAGKHPDLCHGF